MTLKFCAALALAGVAAHTQQPPPAVHAPVEYWLQPPPCVSHRVNPRGRTAAERERAGMIRWCVDRIEIAADRMSVHFTRELSVLSEFALDYKSDQGNRNMYLRDDRGNRYDSVATEGAARTGGRLEARSPLEGSFTFPAPAPGARTLVFYDDDAHVKLEGLRLDPAFVADSPHQQLLRSLMRAADRIELRDAWSGLSAAARPVASHSLRKAGDAWIGDVTFSVSERSKSMPWTADNGTVAAFLDELAGSRLTAAPYVPTFTHTDDYPDLRIEIGAGGGGIEFHTTSQGPDHVPWALDMSGRTLSVPVATPMRAMERLLNTLDKAAMQRLVDELQRDVQRGRGRGNGPS